MRLPSAVALALPALGLGTCELDCDAAGACRARSKAGGCTYDVVWAPPKPTLVGGQAITSLRVFVGDAVNFAPSLEGSWQKHDLWALASAAALDHCDFSPSLEVAPAADVRDGRVVKMEEPGITYFACSQELHCKMGLKLAVSVAQGVPTCHRHGADEVAAAASPSCGSGRKRVRALGLDGALLGAGVGQCAEACVANGDRASLGAVEDGSCVDAGYALELDSDFAAPAEARDVALWAPAGACHCHESEKAISCGRDGDGAREKQVNNIDRYCGSTCPSQCADAFALLHQHYMTCDGAVAPAPSYAAVAAAGACAAPAAPPKKSDDCPLPYTLTIDSGHADKAAYNAAVDGVNLILLCGFISVGLVALQLVRDRFGKRAEMDRIRRSPGEDEAEEPLAAAERGKARRASLDRYRRAHRPVACSWSMPT